MMKKADAIKTISKTIMAGTAAITLSSIAFTGFNNKILASELKKQTAVLTTYNIKTTEISEDYVKADYELIINKLSPTQCKSALSAEAAAEIGAKYIWDMYEESLKGKVLEMSYNISPITSETRWIGAVYENYDKTNKIQGMTEYDVMINAITGERKELGKRNTPSENSQPIPFNEKEANDYYKDKSGEYIKLAEELTKKSYGVKVASSKFDGVAALLSADFKASKDKTENYMATRLYIIVAITDTEGREYEVSITEDTKELDYIFIKEQEQGDYLG